MVKASDKNNISESLKKLEKIVQWFGAQKELDLEEGLKQIKEGMLIAKELKARLNNIENEFKEIKKDLET